MILSQLVDADELMSLSPQELREMICRLDDEVVNGATEILSQPTVEATAGESTP